MIGLVLFYRIYFNACYLTQNPEDSFFLKSISFCKALLWCCPRVMEMHERVNSTKEHVYQNCKVALHYRYKINP